MKTNKTNRRARSTFEFLYVFFQKSIKKRFARARCAGLPFITKNRSARATDSIPPPRSEYSGALTISKNFVCESLSTESVDHENHPIIGYPPYTIKHFLHTRASFLHLIFQISKYRIDPSDRSEGPSRIAISLRNLEGLEWVHCTHSKPGSAMGTLRPWWLEIFKIRVALSPN